MRHPTIRFISAWLASLCSVLSSILKCRELLQYSCLVLERYEPTPFRKAMFCEGSVLSLPLHRAYELRLSNNHTWLISGPFWSLARSVRQHQSVRHVCFVSAPEHVPRSTPLWAVLQCSHHRTLHRAVTAVLSLRPVGEDLTFSLKDWFCRSQEYFESLWSFKTLVRRVSAFVGGEREGSSYFCEFLPLSLKYRP